MNASTPPPPIARTSAGVVRGRSESGGLAVFRGVPFAGAPVGEARFGAPRPVVAWDGVRDALDFGPMPPQTPLGPPFPVPPPTSYDWLTVNVWTPAPDPAARRPVLVWVYGGGYAAGFSAGYDAGRLARQRGTVVVTFNYRVGMEGFPRFPDAPANRGLLDQVAALRWVRENIAAFGGDPDRVTVFGESAGAGSVAALLAMPSARGLFHGAIAQSVPGTYFSPSLAADITSALVAPLGLPPTAAALASQDPHELARSAAALLPAMREHRDRWGVVAHTVTPFSPVVDGEVLPQAPWQALREGAARDVPLIVGHNRDEFRLFHVLSGGGPDRTTPEQTRTALELFGPGPAPESAYRAAFPDASDDDLCVLVQSDWTFRMPTLHLAEAQVTGGGRAHVYELTWPAPADGGALGACHGLDVPLTFGTYDGIAELFGLRPTPEAEAVSEQFRSAWTAFAEEGTPGWQPYDLRSRQVRILDTRGRTAGDPEGVARGLWEGHVFGVLGLAGGAEAAGG
ncbi:carboxylesterase family protein [Streptomyces sp. NPDC093252]|uniref:carboxylesterase/lipase family protein n=1 Tax=Streptomyces sp. NPDC093252 TaxID=3154980 RepID=UPI003431E97E